MILHGRTKAELSQNEIQDLPGALCQAWLVPHKVLLLLLLRVQGHTGAADGGGVPRLWAE